MRQWEQGLQAEVGVQAVQGRAALRGEWVQGCDGAGVCVCVCVCACVSVCVCVYECRTGLWRELEAVPGPLDGRARCWSWSLLGIYRGPLV